MNHDEAVEQMAVERYLLGALDPGAQEEFEEHMFGCPECALDSRVTKVRQILLNLAPRDRSLLKAIFLEQRDRDEVCREFGVDREYLRVFLRRTKQECSTEYVRRIRGPVPLDA